MALDAGARRSPVSLLDQLLEEINFQRTKEMRQLFKDESGFVMLRGTTQWTDLFVRHFLFAEEPAAAADGDTDDLLFFVRKSPQTSCRLAPHYQTVVEVFRKQSRKLPIGDPEIEWEETVYLNLIVHQLEYTLTLAVCTRTGPRALQVLRRCCAKVYASPSRRKMDSKGEGEEITYPHICFMVDNFDEVFTDIVVRDGEMVCVELSARGRGARARAALFLGSVRYDALNRVYDSRQSSLCAKMAQRMSLGSLSAGGAGGAGGRCELLRVRGPHGKGHAEVAVWRARGAPTSGCATPASEPGLSYADLFDPDLDDDLQSVFYPHQRERRLSDPSANLVSFSRGGAAGLPVGGATAAERCRSQQDGLDALAADPAQPEVQAGDVRDAGGSASSGCCGRGGRLSMGDVYRRRAPAYTSARCLDDDGRVTVRGKEEAPAVREYRLPTHIPPQRKGNQPVRLRRPKREQSVDGDTRTGHAKDGATKPLLAEQTVDGGSKPSCVGHAVDGATELQLAGQTTNGTTKPLLAGQTVDGATKPPLQPVERATAPPAPPARTAPDGTVIHYWCDLPNYKYELDDGVYNPVFRRAFGPTFAAHKESRRATCQPLSAALTYLTLPWWAIAKDILDVKEEPILTF